MDSVKQINGHLQIMLRPILDQVTKFKREAANVHKPSLRYGCVITSYNFFFHVAKASGIPKVVWMLLSAGWEELNMLVEYEVLVRIQILKVKTQKYLS